MSTFQKLEHKAYEEYKEYQSEQDIDSFLNEAFLLPSAIVRSVIKKMIRKKDNTLLFILHNSETTPKEKSLEFNYVQSDKKILHYTVIKEGDNNAN